MTADKKTIKKYTVSLLGLGFYMVTLTAPAWATSIPPDNEYLDLDISQLMQITITSVSKKDQTLSDAAAAVFVITQTDIRRSGVSSIPEALRMVPGLQVARIGAEKWAITSRGFNGQTANKLLVLMDGRTLYSPSFSGVYWDVQETFLEDIDRIEVIRGPGGTIWGANAVNGIINIITKKANETTGGLLRVSVGDEERISGGLRYGTEIGESAHARAWLTYRNHDSFQLHDSDENANDNWQSLHGGFRIDGDVSQKSVWTVQGDIYKEDANQLVSPSFTMTPPYVSEDPDNYDASGWNVLARWKQQISSDHSWTLQSYYDFTDRDELYIGQVHKTFDVEIQNQMQLGASHDLICGLGYRNIRDSFDSSFQLLFIPESTSRNLFSVFVQDEITLMADQLWLTVGSKFEHNDFTGYEIQPSGRLLYKPAVNQTIWGAISRAVRTPSRIETDARLTAGMVSNGSSEPVPVFLWGNEEYDSEDVLAYELGYRIVPTKQLSIDIAVFYNEYENLRTATPLGTISTSKIQFENKSSGSSLGFEIAADWKPVFWLSFQLGYTWLELNLDANDGDTGLDIIVVYEDSSPQHSVSLRATIDITQKLQMNLWLRYVDQFTAGGIQALLNGSIIEEYTAVDATLSWKATEAVELMLVGQNLFSSGRMEFVSEYLAPLTDVEQSVYGKLTYRF